MSGTTAQQEKEKAQEQREFNKEETERLRNLLITLENPQIPVNLHIQVKFFFHMV